GGGGRGWGGRGRGPRGRGDPRVGAGAGARSPRRGRCPDPDLPVRHQPARAERRVAMSWESLRARQQQLSRRRLVVGVAGLALFIVAVAYGVHLWRYYDNHVSTDDAFVA